LRFLLIGCLQCSRASIITKSSLSYVLDNFLSGGVSDLEKKAMEWTLLSLRDFFFLGGDRR